METLGLAYAVGKVLDEVLKAVDLCIHANKNLEGLRKTLTQLVPLVAEISKSTGPTDPAGPWLQELEERLLKAKEIVDQRKHQHMRLPHKRLNTSKKVVDVMESLNDSYRRAPLAAWATNQRVLSEMKAEMIKQRKIWSDLELAQVTREALNTRTANLGSFVFSISPSDAMNVIRSQADLERARRANYTSAEASESDGGAPSMTSSNSRDAAPLGQLALRRIKRDEIVGGDEFVKDVTALLCETNQKSDWVGIWSMGGAGKTLTAKRVCDSPEARNKFRGGIFWLDVGRQTSPLSLLSQLYTQLTSLEKDFRCETDARAAVERKLCSISECALLVLDDVWSTAILKSLDVFSGSAFAAGAAAAGSKTLITTRDRTILHGLHAQNVQIGMLSDEHSWQLFCLHAFGCEEDVPTMLDAYARDVMKECKGLPLALKVIGATMAGKSDPEQWKVDLRRLQNAVILSKAHEEQLYHKLQLSLDDLPAVDECLMDCFYYFAAFPEDQRVTLFELLGVWMADLEGIARGADNGVLTPEDVAYKNLGHLIDRSLIELHVGNPKRWQEQERLHYKIHDVLRDLIRHNLQHQREPQDILCLYQPGMRMKKFPEKWLQISSPALSLRAVRMSLMYNELEELPSQQLLAPHLRVLLLGNNFRLQVLPNRFLANLAELRVLDLKKTSIQEIPSTALQGLRKLKVLDLSHSELRRLPDSIKQLQSLTELRLSSCSSLLEISEGVKHLQKLTTLDLSLSENLGAVPSCVRSLTGLKYLNMYRTPVWDQESRSSSRLFFFQPGPAFAMQDVVCLTSLVELTIFSQKATSLPVDFGKLKQLTKLSIFFSMIQAFANFSQLTEMESLTLNCFQLKALPAGIKSLTQLTRLNLSGCISLTSLPELDQLPLLKELDISACQSLTKMPESFGCPGAFPSLNVLEMSACNKAAFPILRPGAMPRLVVLWLAGWSQLETLPESIRVLSNTLRCLRLSLCLKLETLEPVFDDQTSFPHLEELFLKNTRVARLPEGLLASRPNLRKLDLQHCPAQHNLPMEIQNADPRKLEIIK